MEILKEVEVVPSLRFVEFSDSWENIKLGRVAIFLDGKRKPIKASDRTKMRGEFPYYGASGIIDYVNNFIFDDELILLGEDGENIISRNLPLAFRVSGKCWINNHAHVIKPKKDTDIDFLTHSLERISYVKYNTGTAQPKLNQEVCRGIILTFPTLPEQQKIASFLSAVDKKIEQLSQKKTLLEKYKKGVMQKIFSQKLRFKDDDGYNYPNWEEKKLGEIVVEYREKSKFKDEYPVFTSSNRGLMLQSDYYGENRLTERDNTGFNIIPQNFITYRSRSDNRKFTFNLNTLKTKGIISTYYPVFDVYKGKSKFLVEYLNFKQNFVGKYSVGTSQTVLSFNELCNLKFKIPRAEEQKKIASFLSEIDNKIELVNTQLNQTKVFKKGLLQQMFV